MLPTANQLARALRDEYGVQPADRIGVLGHANAMKPIYHALWQLGACAVPLDVGTLTNTQTLNAANAIYLIAHESKLARAVRAVEPGMNDVVGAANCREVVQFGGEAGSTFAHLDSLAATHADQPIPPPTNWAGDDDDAALLLCLYFMEKVQLFTYTQAELRDYARRRQTEDKPRFRPKLSALTFYPIADELVHVLTDDANL
jgi:acyl-CoA synthetase (AMP-forming)/AMP-acid ligase II